MKFRHARWLLLPPALFALACALLAPAEAGRVPAARRPAPQDGPARRKGEAAGDSTVRGRVVYDDTSRPARRARVILVGEGGARTEYGALTDARGQFSIAGVRAGTYFTFVDVPGVLSPVAFVNVDDLRGGAAGMPDLGEGRAFFDLVEVDGKQDVDVVVHARRGASISGLVTHADGDPAVNVTVNLLRRGAGGRLQRLLTGANLISLSGLRTDDRGIFRLTGLPPGEYVIGVSEAVDHSPDGGRHRRSDDIPGMLEGMMGQQLLMTFYPAATTPKEAAVVKVAAGEERTGVDIRIPERDLRTVSGVVRSRRDRRPLARARVSIERKDDPLDSSRMALLYDASDYAANSTTTDEDGRWQFTEIPDGPYTISVTPAQEFEPDATASFVGNMNVSVANSSVYSSNTNGDYRPPRRKKGHAPARRDVEVSGGDLLDVNIEAGEGARVSGRMTFEGGQPLAYGHVLFVRAGGAAEGADPSGAHNADVNRGEFSADGLPPGRFFLQPRTYEGEGALYVKSISWNGKDLMREPLEVAEGATVEGVQVVFARDTATLRVTAVRAGGREPAHYAFVFLHPADASAWSLQHAPQLSCSTSDDGACSVKAPPGDYHVVVLPRKLVRGAVEAEVRRRAAGSPRVTLRGGETKELEVSVPEK